METFVAVLAVSIILGIIIYRFCARRADRGDETEQGVGGSKGRSVHK